MAAAGRAGGSDLLLEPRSFKVKSRALVLQLAREAQLLLAPATRPRVATRSDTTGGFQFTDDTALEYCRQRLRLAKDRKFVTKYGPFQMHRDRFFEHIFMLQNFFKCE